MTKTTRKPKILYVGHFDIPGLMARCRAGQAPSNHVHALPDLERLGYEVTGFNMGPADQVNAWQAQSRIMQACGDSDFVIAHSHHDIRWLALWRRLGRLQTPIGAFVHSHTVRPWHRLFLPGYDMLWPVGQWGEDQVLANGARADRVARFPYGADLKYYPTALAWNDADPIVLSVGVSGRDFGTLIDAATLIKAPIHVVGKVAPEDVKRAPASVTFHSQGNYDLPFEALIALYARAGCVAVVHHGSKHPYGNTAIVEAMALGRPVVCTDSVSLDLAAGRLGFGRSVPAHDAAGLADAVNEVVANPTTAKLMGEVGRSILESEFNCERGAAALSVGIACAIRPAS
jgi:glycosyltransferase involved in cell wall biosynthesis